MAVKAEDKPGLLPWPVAEVLRQSHEKFSSQWLSDLSPLIVKVLEWSFFFFLGYLGFGYSWVLFLALMHYVKYSSDVTALSRTLMFKLSALSSEKEVLGSALSHFPAWVAFPDFDRVEWINDIISQLWPTLDGYATTFIVQFIEPEIQKILDTLGLEKLSGFKVKKVALGTIPARLGGIKVYPRYQREEIVLDCDVGYNGNARVIFTLQNVQAEINEIEFRGRARITLKPILSSFPFIGGFEFYFETMPIVKYSLGGIGTIGLMPGANMIIQNVVHDQIRSRFVWPNKFHLYLPIDEVKKAPDQSYKLRKPEGILAAHIIEAADLEAKDTSFTGSGKSDPYVNLSIAKIKFGFRDQYVPKTLNPVWNYKAEFVLEEVHHWQDLRIEVYDHDNASADDFLGDTSISVHSVVRDSRPGNEPAPKWLQLNGVKHGKVQVSCCWSEAYPVEQEALDDFETFIVSVYIDSCDNLGEKPKHPPTKPKVSVSSTQGPVGDTKEKHKTGSPIFQEPFLFTCRLLANESIHIHVTDGKVKLGQLKIPLMTLVDYPRREFFSNNFVLEKGLNSEAQINMSAKLYGTKKRYAL